MTIQQRIDAARDTRKMKMDWLGLESILRDILKTEKPTPALRQIDEAVAAFTKRGSVYT